VLPARYPCTPRAIECCRVDRTIAKPELPNLDLGLEHAEADDPVMPFPHHQRIDFSPELCFGHPFPEHGWNTVFQDKTVNSTGPFHPLDLVRTLHGPRL
jgi:hypothetical protein